MREVSPITAPAPPPGEPPGVMDVYFPPESSIATWYQGKAGTSTGAGFSLTLGLLAILCFFTVIGGTVLGAGAVVAGHRARSRIRPYGTRRQNGMALAGLVAGYTGIAASLLVVLGIYQFSRTFDRGRLTKTETNIATLTAYIDVYIRKNNGQPPAMTDGLRALIIKRIVTDESLLTDPWGASMHYQIPGTRSKDRFDVWSSGPDRVSGNGDDIGNWQPPD